MWKLCYLFLGFSTAYGFQRLPPKAGGNTVAAAWYAGWHADAGFPLSDVSWSKYTHLTYAFAETTPDVHTLNLSGSDPSLLPQFVSEAHNNGVKALVSIGGWTGSRFFSTHVGSAQNRTAFVKTVTTFAQTYALDGLDFDWESPAAQGIGCNAVSATDTAHFLSFLQALRADALGATLLLTAAVGTVPFTGPHGAPIADASGFSDVLDWIAVMDYDIWGPWSATVGPNAPLNDTCAPAQNQAGSAVSAPDRAGGGGVRACVPGPAARAFGPGGGAGGVLVPFPGFDAGAHPAGDAWDDAAGVDECGNPQAAGGDIDFWGLVQLGYLDADGTPQANIAYRFDTCSQTPYVYNSTTEIMVSFDNAQSFAAKGNFIKTQGLRGFAMWEAGGDFNNILLNSIRTAAGLCVL
ncbi:chitinase [Pholiota molesta]|nr:chitinase [Pholiota molesta]